MILLDSIYINNSGGLMLLKYLVDCLEKSNIKVFYLFDKRTEDIFSTIPANKRKFLPASIPERLKFYTVNLLLIRSQNIHFCLPNPATRNKR